jgi:putative membrane protein
MKNSFFARPLLHRAAGVFAIGALAVLPARAQSTYPTTNPNPSTPTSPSSQPDTLTPKASTKDDYGTKNMKSSGVEKHSEKIISKISMLNSEQLRLSQIASQRATDAGVKSFADQLKTSSQDFQQEIDQLAQSKNVMYPTGKNANDLASEEQKWQKKDANDFDEDYVKRIVKTDKEAIDELEDYSKSKNADPEVAALADKHLPGLRANLQQAKSLRKKVD